MGKPLDGCMKLSAMNQLIFVNKELLGRLASLGIEKGKAFNPDARMQHIFEQAAKLAVAMARTNAFDSRDPDVKEYFRTDNGKLCL